MTSADIRKKYIEFFVSRGHKEIAPAKLVLVDDPTTLFTSSGMQPLVPYLLGEKHPEGNRLVNSQPSFRSEDIDEVGDNRHTTFFEMLGNWSLGDYFKKEQLPWIWEFLTSELSLPKEKLYVSIFEGNEIVPKDEESLEIWKSLGVSENHIFEYGVEKNWWSKSGKPENMPLGEIGGPDSEIFYEFTQVPHDKKFGEKCHPNCDCGRFLEIGNSVFIQYKKVGDGEFEQLPQKNVDFGGGLERLAAAINDDADIFKSGLFLPLIEKIEFEHKVKYGKDFSKDQSIRIIADHLKGSVMLIRDGVLPSNKLQGYMLRRLIRRAVLHSHELNSFGINGNRIGDIVRELDKIYPEFGLDIEMISLVVQTEAEKFLKAITKGLNIIEQALEKQEKIDGTFAFNLYQSNGFPIELTLERLEQKGMSFAEADQKIFEEEFKRHQDLSRTASAGMFKGGLAGHSEVEVKYHTATHLLHQALRDVLGESVFQKGSNITPERLRFDFSFDRKMTEDEVKRVEEIVNKKIKEDLKVDRTYMTYDEAKALNAIGLFDEKYDKTNVSIYSIGPDYKLDPDSKDLRPRNNYYSLEFCGGPHVEHTGVIGGIKITKEEAVSAGMRRIRAELI